MEPSPGSPRKPFRFERTLELGRERSEILDTPLALEARLGPVTVHSVSFSTESTRMKNMLRRVNKRSLIAALNAIFDIDNPEKTPWTVALSVEFLDGSGQALQGQPAGGFRASERFEDERQDYKVECSLPKALAPSVAKARITIEAAHEEDP